MNEKQSMLLVIGNQTMAVAVLQDQVARLQAEIAELKKQVAPAPSVPSTADTKE